MNFLSTLWVLAIPMVLLAAFVAAGNIRGCVWAAQNKKNGIDKGYSNVPFVSLLLCGCAYVLAKDTLGFWVLIPALVDPGTLMTLYFPWVVWTEFIKPICKTKQNPNKAVQITPVPSALLGFHLWSRPDARNKQEIRSRRNAKACYALTVKAIFILLIVVELFLALFAASPILVDRRNLADAVSAYHLEPTDSNRFALEGEQTITSRIRLLTRLGSVVLLAMNTYALLLVWRRLRGLHGSRTRIRRA